MTDDDIPAAPVTPVNPLPPVIVIIALLLFGVEAVLSLGGAGYPGTPDSIGWRAGAIRDHALRGDMQAWMLQSGQFPADYLARYLTYPLVHSGFVHMALATAIFLALGKVVAETFAAWSVVAVFVLSSVAGAVAFGLTGTSQWLLGAYPGVFGILGSFTFLLWADPGARGAGRYRAFTLIGALLAIRLVFGLLFGAGLDWIAEVAGFATGFGLSFVLGPGGPGRIIAGIRRR